MRGRGRRSFRRGGPRRSRGRRRGRRSGARSVGPIRVGYRM